MRIRAPFMAPLVAVAAASAQAEVRFVDVASPQLLPTPPFSPRIDPSDRATRMRGGSHIRPGQIAGIRTIVGGIDARPFVTVIPGGMWRGRLRSFGAADGEGLSGIVARARAIGPGWAQPDRPVAGFLATGLHYGMALDRDDLLTLDLGSASQRMPARQVLGPRRAVRVGSLHLGASLTHAQRLVLNGGWYWLSVSRLPALSYAIERSAGMPAPGQGMWLGAALRLGGPDGREPPRIGLEWRDGEADRDRSLMRDPAVGREHRILLRFSQAF